VAGINEAITLKEETMQHTKAMTPRKPTQPDAANPRGGIAALLEKHKITLSKLLPPGTPIERYMLAVKLAVDRNPKLSECTTDSLYLAVMQSAMLGLEVGHYNMAHIVPYWKSSANRYEAQFQIGYQGLRYLGKKHGDVADDDVGIVCEHDELEFEAGPNAYFRHKYDPTDRGPIVAYYCWAKTKAGSLKICVMSRAEILAWRDRFAKKDRDGNIKISDAWAQHEEAMALKTCVIRCYKFLAQSPELARAIQLDEEREAEIESGLSAALRQETIAEARAANEAVVAQLRHPNHNHEGAASVPPADVSEPAATEAPGAPSPASEPSAPDDSTLMDCRTALREASAPDELTRLYKSFPEPVRRALNEEYSRAMLAFAQARRAGR
jgi:recombination protein RecT